MYVMAKPESNRASDVCAGLPQSDRTALSSVYLAVEVTYLCFAFQCYSAGIRAVLQHMDLGLVHTSGVIYERSIDV